jgi:hypothetical protein
MPSVQTISGSGDFKDASLISFSYSEDATPISPAKLEGGTGQITAQLVSNEYTKGSRIAINNEALLSDEEYGDVNFTIKKVSLNNGLVSVIGSTIQSRLDVERTALPQGSNAGGYNLYEAILYYCYLVDITPNFEPGLQAKIEPIDVDFIGWKGSVWEYLKMLCAAALIDDNSGFMEMYIVEDQLWFREGGLQTVSTKESISDQSLEIDAYDAAQTVQVFKYETDYRANSLVRQDNVESQNYANLELVSIVDSFQVNANEKITRRVTINASLEEVEQPIAVQTIVFPINYGQYVIVGKDQVPLTAAQWNDQGGSVSASITENPNELEITIIGANYPDLEPFKIGVESAGGDDYPAFYLRGTGVFFEKTAYTIYTGAPESEIAESTTIDNPFITSDEVLWNKGVRIAQGLCGPSIQLNQSLSTGAEFGTLTGSIVDAFETRFRINSTSFNQSGVEIQANSYVTFADFDSAWSDSTFENFNTSMNGVSFNEFSVIPLVKE